MRTIQWITALALLLAAALCAVYGAALGPYMQRGPALHFIAAGILAVLGIAIWAPLIWRSYAAAVHDPNVVTDSIPDDQEEQPLFHSNILSFTPIGCLVLLLAVVLGVAAGVAILTLVPLLLPKEVAEELTGSRLGTRLLAGCAAAFSACAIALLRRLLRTLGVRMFRGRQSHGSNVDNDST